MTRYFLAHGETVTGPFPETEFLTMSESGAIQMGAQVAMEGTEDWFPADDLVKTLRAERKEAKRNSPHRSTGKTTSKKKRINSLWFAAGLIVTLLIAATLFSAERYAIGTLLLAIPSPALGLAWLIVNHLEHTGR